MTLLIAPHSRPALGGARSGGNAKCEPPSLPALEEDLIDHHVRPPPAVATGFLARPAGLPGPFCGSLPIHCRWRAQSGRGTTYRGLSYYNILGLQ